jgi:hypothetical protein
MNIEDFLPKYPNINKEKNGFLNPYTDNFYDAIYKKKEFYDERLPLEESFPTEKGTLMKHQKIIARFLSSHTIYNELILVHEMGSGKSCSAIGAIEKIKNEDNNFKGVYIFAKGVTLLNNFKKELRDKCTGGQYIPEGYVAENKSGCGKSMRRHGGLTEKELTIRSKKLYDDYYHFSIGPNKPTTFETFARHLHNLSDSDIIEMYSNYIIVIDEVHNLRIHDNTENDKISMYKEFHRFLHLIKNRKILLLSGTPMKDTPDEIASVMNLILPLDNQLSVGDKFISEYLDDNNKGNYKVKDSMINKLKSKFKGRVSFLKSMRSQVTKKFHGETKVGKLQHFIIQPVNMSKFQTIYYTKALEEDSKEKSGVYINARQASLFVFPDGTYGKVGFSKYINFTESLKTFRVKKTSKPVNVYNMNEALKKKLKGVDNKETLKNVNKYSTKYAYVIESILNATGQSCFVYCDFVAGSGAILFSKILELFDFKESKGLDGDRKGLRYGLLTSKTSTYRQVSKIIDCFNQPTNMNGEIIKVLIGSKIISEGVSFYNVQQEFILTPWYNFSETDQAIARGYRFGSHRELIKNKIKPQVTISLMAAIPKKVMSIDLHMYEISEDKDITIKAIMRILMESAFDCSLNYLRNYIGDEEGNRECDYNSCDYKCDGVQMKDITDGVDIKEIDYSTYQLYYADPKISDLKKKLEKFFRTYNNSDIKTIENFFVEDYTTWEINNALKSIEKKNDNIYYSDYIKQYSKSNVQKIIIVIQQLFRTYFRLSLEDIVQRLSEKNFNTKFDILSALKNIIDENIVIKNKFGFLSYLREDKNIYFLVNNLSISNDSLSDYYSRIPNIINEVLFSDMLYDIQIELMPDFISKFCNITDESDFSKMIKYIPPNIQEIFIENAILAHKQNIPTRKNFRNMILKYFVNYIHELENMWVSNRLFDNTNVSRCLENDTWEDCDEKQHDLLVSSLVSKKNKLQNNEYGYYGIFNPETKTFSIVNLIKQNKERKLKYKKHEEKLTKEVKKGNITENEKIHALKLYQDARLVYPGKNCLKGWTVSEIMKIILKVVRIDYPKTFKKKNKNKTDQDLKNIILSTQHTGIGKGKKPPIYTPDEIDNLSRDDLLRIVFWGIKPSGGHLKHLCAELQKWFKTNNMLIPDKEAGTAGGHKKLFKKPVNTPEFRLVKIIPNNNPAVFKTHLANIQKLMARCFKIPRYKLDDDINKKQWNLIFFKKKMAGFFVVDKSNKRLISNVCFSDLSIKKKLSQDALQFAIKNPEIHVERINKSYTKHIKRYNEYGFSIINTDEKFTVMKLKNTT